VTDWIGSLKLSERSAHRVVLSMTTTTRVYGWVLTLLGVLMTLPVWFVSPWAALLPVLAVLLGVTLVSLRRTLTFDRQAGVLSLEQRTFGIASRDEIPLFHLRAVVVMAQAGPGSGKYVAFVDRRVGGPIYLDEARRIARLMKMAEAVAEVAELRLEYNAAG
jgi:hypothetical protein